MKIVHIETLISKGTYPKTKEWADIRQQLQFAISDIDWPRGSGKFTIYPQSGKKRGEGNGVKPIKESIVANLAKYGWKLEECLNIAVRKQPGPLDAVYYGKEGIVVFEWETGNISSSHRAINKMALGLLKKIIVGGILVVPSRKLYPYLTDRVGNFDELVPYLELWQSIPCKNGVLEIFVIEQDAESFNVPRIPKGTDGRAII